MPGLIDGSAHALVIRPLKTPWRGTWVVTGQLSFQVPSFNYSRDYARYLIIQLCTYCFTLLKLVSLFGTEGPISIK